MFLQNNTSLLSLKLSGNKIGNRGATYLATILQVNATLQELHLDDCDLVNVRASTATFTPTFTATFTSRTLFTWVKEYLVICTLYVSTAKFLEKQQNGIYIIVFLFVFYVIFILWRLLCFFSVSSFTSYLTCCVLNAVFGNIFPYLDPNVSFTLFFFYIFLGLLCKFCFLTSF